VVEFGGSFIEFGSSGNGVKEKIDICFSSSAPRDSCFGDPLGDRNPGLALR
jgi:hypothetical protein